MRALYPEIEPYQTGTLPVSPLHTLAYEQCGNPGGRPVVYLHGGPGGGISPDARRYFNPEVYRVVLFDQRGAGKSTPYAELRENNTWELVEDLEKLRLHLRIERWLVFGGSWGSTLALCYAIAHPERVVGLVMRGIYLGRRWENQWLFQEGASYFYPDRYAEYVRPIPPEERQDLIGAYYRRLTDSDESVHLAAVGSWSDWEGGLVRLIPEPPPVDETPLRRLAIARFECHYIVNDMFFPRDNYILENAGRIANLPCRIVQGRYDVVCPARSAWELHQALPLSKLVIVQEGAHTARDPAMASELVQALDDSQILFD